MNFIFIGALVGAPPGAGPDFGGSAAGVGANPVNAELARCGASVAGFGAKALNAEGVAAEPLGAWGPRRENREPPAPEGASVGLGSAVGGATGVPKEIGAFAAGAEPGPNPKDEVPGTAGVGGVPNPENDFGASGAPGVGATGVATGAVLVLTGNGFANGVGAEAVGAAVFGAGAAEPNEVNAVVGAASFFSFAGVTGIPNPVNVLAGVGIGAASFFSPTDGGGSFVVADAGSPGILNCGAGSGASVFAGIPPITLGRPNPKPAGVLTGALGVTGVAGGAIGVAGTAPPATTAGFGLLVSLWRMRSIAFASKSRFSQREYVRWRVGVPCTWPTLAPSGEPSALAPRCAAPVMRRTAEPACETSGWKCCGFRGEGRMDGAADGLGRLEPTRRPAAESEDCREMAGENGAFCASVVVVAQTSSLPPSGCS